MLNKILLPMMLLTITLNSQAQTQTKQAMTEQQINQSGTQYSSLEELRKKQYSEQAARWGLTGQDWEKFEEIKKGPRGYWSPKLDPLTTLGIEAESSVERERYAEIQAKMEFERAEKELAYQRAYTAAFKRLYPNRLPIENLGKPKLSVSHISSKQRLAVFVKQNCKACNDQILQFQKNNIPMDIYMTDSNNDDGTIRKWATKIGINPKQVLSKTITLNHGATLWKSVGHDNMPLPAIFQEVNGQLVRK